MNQQIFNVSGQIPALVDSCSLTMMEQLQYGGIAVVTLLLLVILVRSLTSFVKAVRS